jgi:hypothetical protein
MKGKLLEELYLTAFIAMQASKGKIPLHLELIDFQNLEIIDLLMH